MAVFHSGCSASNGYMFEEAQLGVFLVIPKSDGDFRLALLRREASDAARLLHRMFSATQLEADWNCRV
jgi:hypothetical protein